MHYTYKDSLEKSKQWHVKGIKLDYITDIPKVIFGDVQVKSYHKTKELLKAKGKFFEVTPQLSKVPIFKRVRGYVKCLDEKQNEGYLRIIEPAKGTYILLLVTLMVCLGGIFGYWSYLHQQELNKQQMQRLEIYDAPESIVNDDPSKINLPAYTNIQVDAKTGESNSPLINVFGNKVKMRYTILNKKTKEIYFKANKLLNPGKAFYKYKLDNLPKKGIYQVYVKITNYSLNGKEKINSSSIAAEMIVK